jgi:hypothetical protein
LRVVTGCEAIFDFRFWIFDYYKIGRPKSLSTLEPTIIFFDRRILDFSIQSKIGNRKSKIALPSACPEQ